jgi:hypothetical protein
MPRSTTGSASTWRTLARQHAEASARWIIEFWLSNPAEAPWAANGFTPRAELHRAYTAEVARLNDALADAAEAVKDPDDAERRLSDAEVWIHEIETRLSDLRDWWAVHNWPHDGTYLDQARPLLRQLKAAKAARTAACAALAEAKAKAREALASLSAGLPTRQRRAAGDQLSTASARTFHEVATVLLTPTARRGVRGYKPPAAPEAAKPVGYTAAHKRVAAERGPASDHFCEARHGNPRCNVRAQEWALSPRTRRSRILRTRSGLAYSLDVNDYVPWCRSCHRQADLVLLFNAPEDPAPDAVADRMAAELYPIDPDDFAAWLAEENR